MNGSQTHFILDHLTTAEGLGWKLYDFPTYSTIIMLDYTYEKVYRIKILKQWSAVRNKNRIKAHVNVLMWWLCLLRTTWMKSTDCEWITDHTLGTPYRNRSLSPTRLSLSPCFSLPLNHTTRRSLIKCVYFFTLVFSKDIELCVCVCVCVRARVCACTVTVMHDFSNSLHLHHHHHHHLKITCNDISVVHPVLTIDYVAYEHLFYWFLTVKLRIFVYFQHQAAIKLHLLHQKIVRGIHSYSFNCKFYNSLYYYDVSYRYHCLDY